MWESACAAAPASKGAGAPPLHTCAFRFPRRSTGRLFPGPTERIMRRFPTYAPLALAGALLLPFGVSAADKAQLTDPDFIAQAAEAGTGEIKLAELADAR